MPKFIPVGAREAAETLVVVEPFIMTLDRLMKKGEARRYRGPVKKTPIDVPVAVVSVDWNSFDDVFSGNGQTKKYQLALGIADELFHEQIRTDHRYVEREFLGDGLFGEGKKPTGWRREMVNERYLLGFGGWMWSQDSYHMMLIVPGKFQDPVTHASSILEALAEKKHPESFVKPSACTAGNQNIYICY